MSETPEGPPSQAGSPVDGDTRFVACDPVLSAPLSGEIVLLEPVAGVYYSLNEVGSRIWELVQVPISFEDLCGHIEAEYDVDPAVCESDVRAILTDLMSQHLVETVPDEGGTASSGESLGGEPAE